MTYSIGETANAIVVITLGCFATATSAQEQESAASMSEDVYDPSFDWSAPITTGTMTVISWTTFVNLCGIIAPTCTALLSLAPLPTMYRISRDNTVGKLPLLPYSMMLSASSLWLLHGLLERLLSVSKCSIVGVIMGACYITVFVKHCGPNAINLPGTVPQHLKAAEAIVLCNLCLAASGVAFAADVIGKEAVIVTIVLFAGPLVVMKRVIASKSAASIPLPFTLS
ncbi:hypothetical protein ACHAWU_005527 [Discostella pseudostelligera]|uniref:Uncharacterized protein n=1 Tax=Discostella pseudostelligera TaxID=259834 RepID=A0ABD3NA50_9STRA